MTTLMEAYAAIAHGPVKAAGLRSFEYIPGSDEWPAAWLMPPQITYGSLGPCIVEARVDVVVMVTASVDKHQLKLFPYMDLDGPQSIAAAVLADPSCGGVPGLNVAPIRARSLSMEEQAGFNGYGALVELAVTIS